MALIHGLQFGWSFGDRLESLTFSFIQLQGIHGKAPTHTVLTVCIKDIYTRRLPIVNNLVFTKTSRKFLVVSNSLPD